MNTMTELPELTSQRAGPGAPDQPAVSVPGAALAKARPWLLLAPILVFLAVLATASLVVLRMMAAPEDSNGKHGRMPKIASYVVDQAAVTLISNWITSLTTCPQ